MGLMDRLKSKAGEYKTQKTLNRASSKEIKRKAKTHYWKARESEAIKVAKEKGRKAARPRSERAAKRLEKIAKAASKAYKGYERKSNKSSPFSGPDTVFGQKLGNKKLKPRKKRRRKIVIYQ